MMGVTSLRKFEDETFSYHVNPRVRLSLMREESAGKRFSSRRFILRTGNHDGRCNHCVVASDEQVDKIVERDLWWSSWLQCRCQEKTSWDQSPFKTDLSHKTRRHICILKFLLLMCESLLQPELGSVARMCQYIKGHKLISAPLTAGW